jgi:tetratricopeptide (TPR) repeat protein
MFISLRIEPIQRRVQALPYYAQTYWNKWRPKPDLPPPPAVSAVDTDTLLVARDQVNQLTDAPPQAQAGSGVVPAGQPEVKLAETNLIEVAPAAGQVRLSGISHEWQTWNNCGPVTIAMNLSYFGHPGTQVESAQFLKPNSEDKNVNPTELAAYARSQGLEAMTNVGGSVDLLKRLLSNGLPVIVETWLDVEDNGGLGHYRLFVGYDEAENVFIAEDSLHGSGIKVAIPQFDAFWQVFNRKYVLIYHPDQAALVHAILGSQAVESIMYEQALLTAQNEAKLNPENAYTWFNIGTNYALLGESELAASAFDEARRLGLPYRMLWYQFEIFETYLAVGRYQEVIALSTATLDATSGLEELYYYRGQAEVALNQRESAAADFRAALAYNPNFARAAQALQEVES